MDKIKQHKEIVIIAVIILTLVFYWFQLRPAQVIKEQQIDNANSLKLSVQCKRDGEKNLEDDKTLAVNEGRKEGVSRCFYQDPKFIFNKSLNSCLYSGGYICDLDKKFIDSLGNNVNAKRWSYHITDIYSNKTISDVYIDDSSVFGDFENNLMTKFWEKSHELGF